MDTITQMALGAVIGHAVGYKKLGGKAAAYGALGGLIPDLDVFYSGLFGPYGDWQYHRHITHSIFFAPIVAPLLGWLTWKLHKKIEGHYGIYVWVWLLAIFTHPLLDTLTVYGTMLLAPFSNERFTIPAVSIIDPVYSLILFLALLWPVVPRLRPYTGRVAIGALILSTAYLAYGWQQNIRAEKIAATQIAEQGIGADKVAVYTTIFQPYLRRIVVRETHGGQEWIRVGYVSSIKPQPIKWICRAQDGTIFREMILKTEGGRLFDWFSDNELSYARKGDKIQVMDARYGTPGDSVFGFWGLEFSARGDIIDVNEEPTFIRAPREATKEAITQLFRAAYGLPNGFLPAEDQNCP